MSFRESHTRRSRYSIRLPKVGWERMLTQLNTLTYALALGSTPLTIWAQLHGSGSNLVNVLASRTLSARNRRVMLAARRLGIGTFRADFARYSRVADSDFGAVESRESI